MTTFLFIRHGQTDFVGRALAGRTPGVHLSEEGRAQAGRLADRLARAPVTALYSSPSERTLETAAPVGERLGLSVTSLPGLSEIDFGEWTGRTFQALDAEDRWRRYNHFRSGTRVPGGEHPLEVQARVILELDRLRDRHPQETVALFSHADVIRAAVAYYLGMPIDLYLRLTIHPASVTAITVGDWGPQLLCLNELGEGLDTLLR